MQPAAACSFTRAHPPLYDPHTKPRSLRLRQNVGRTWLKHPTWPLARCCVAGDLRCRAPPEPTASGATEGAQGGGEVPSKRRDHNQQREPQSKTKVAFELYGLLIFSWVKRASNTAVRTSNRTDQTFRGCRVIGTLVSGWGAAAARTEQLVSQRAQHQHTRTHAHHTRPPPSPAPPLNRETVGRGGSSIRRRSKWPRKKRIIFEQQKGEVVGVVLGLTNRTPHAQTYNVYTHTPTR